MKPATFVLLYWWRLRAHPFQELLAGAGIAIGVALAFAVMVANGSIGGSSDAIVRSVVGTADWQLAARGNSSFDARVLRTVRALPHVRQAAPVLDQRAIVATADRDVPVNAASITPDLARLSGRFGLLAGGLQLVQGLMLTTAAAERLGLPDPAKIPTATRLPHVMLEIRGRAIRMPVAAVLGDQTVGPLASAPVAILPLNRLQALTGMRGMVTRVLVEADPGSEASVRRELAPLAGAMHLNLTRADVETGMLRQALGPSNWTTGFFAAISAIVGLLLAFNAMLLTAPERRRWIAETRMNGYTDRQVLGIVLAQATMLGAAASAVGVAAGWLLAQGLFNASPGYLSPAFIPGSATMVGLVPVAVADVGGIMVACLASLPPLLDLRRKHPIDRALHTGGEASSAVSGRAALAGLAVAVVLVIGAGVLLATIPSAALAAVAVLATATVCATPAVFASAVGVAEIVSRHSRRSSMLTVAVFGLQSATLRSLALAATGAVAVFGCVSIGGARTDLLRGIDAYTADYVGTADLWVVNGSDNQATGSIDSPGLANRIRHTEGVEAVRTYHGTFLDWRSRRVWIIARPAKDRTMLPASQMRSGDLRLATARLRRGGWVAVSDQLAASAHASIGDRITIPTPSGPMRPRVAAITTNLGWTPGAVIMSSSDYRRGGWASTPSAVEIDIAPDASAPATQRQIAAIIGDGLRVQTTSERAAGIDASARQGLTRLSQISTLLLVGAVLAMAAAMSAAIWQRRHALAGHRILGFTPRRLWRGLLLETTVVLGAGCLAGALLGMIGQVAIDQYLIAVTGFPVSIVPAGWDTVETFAIVVVAALAVIAVPGWRAASAPPHLGLQPEQ